MIKAIYGEDPNFPASDNHPDAIRYLVGGKYVDAIGGKPTQDEVDAALGTTVASRAAAAREILQTEFDDLYSRIDKPMTESEIRRLIFLVVKLR